MRETAKYCQECIDKFLPATRKQTEEEKEFWNAQTSSIGNPQGPQTKQGFCYKCGKTAAVTFYLLNSK